MGQLKRSRIIIVIFCLLLTGIAVHRQGGVVAPVHEKPRSLADTLVSMGKWHNAGNIPLDQKIVDELQLDDYLFRSFSNGRETVTLYIGYYYTGKKVGAAHDPVVCFPGQGWVLSGMEQHKIPVFVDAHEYQVHYSSMIAERDEKKEFLVYWFQADDQAIPGTFDQKVALLRGNLFGGGEGNAFVRISVALESQTAGEALDTIRSFIDDFYPIFFEYILASESGRK